MSTDIANVLSARSIAMINAESTDPDSSGVAHVFIEIGRDSRNRQIPSNSTLLEAKAELLGLGHRVEFVLVDTKTRDLETGLRATLLMKYGQLVRNAFMSVEGQHITVWLDSKRALDTEEVASLTKTAELLLSAAGLGVVNVQTLSEGSNVPTNTSCLAMLREIAPATALRLSEKLREAGLVVPSDDWMGRKLDLLRKHGAIVRNPDGTFVLSAKSLSTLGTRKNRASPDIRRMLALAAGRR